jgi:alanine racemase
MPILPTHRRAWIVVDLDAVVANAAALASLLPSSVGLMAVVKADAYGHGAIPISLALQRSGVRSFGVATLDEALALRDAGVEGRILVLYDIPPDAAPDAAAAGLELSAGSIQALRALIAGAAPRRFVHLKVDSGMTRQGIPAAAVGTVERELHEAAPWIAGVWTHLRDGADPESAAGQRAAFGRAVAALAAIGVRGERHASASAAILARSVADEDFVRPGLALYGAIPDELTAAGGGAPTPLRPAMAVRARPVRILDVPAGTPVGYGGTFVTAAESRLATLPLGYADGIARTLSNGRGSALVHGREVPIVGRISMDSLVVDVTGVPALGPDDVFTLLGRDGDEAIGIERMAEAAGTIPQEIGVRLNARLPRIFG